MKKYNQLNQEQRYQIYGLRKANINQKKIALEVGVNCSTISRELKRNSGKKGYRPKQAQELAIIRKKTSYKAIKLNEQLKKTINNMIMKDWSPEQISGYLLKNNSINISHESIYQYILQDKSLGGSLYKQLRRSQKKKKKRYGSNDRRGQIPNRIFIDHRPKVVDEKSRIGDWEIDTIIGKNHKGALVTIVERKTKFTIIAKVKNKTAEEVTNATIALLMPFKEKVLTITADNGKEFAYHSKIAEALQANVYFAHPYHSWERGLNENTNGLIRQYVPKKTDFTNITHEIVEKIIQKLNNRPRKTLKFETPNNLFYNDNRQLNLVALNT